MFTPGSWKTTPTTSHIFTNTGVICKMADNHTPLQWACEPASIENSANAHLIAAAPEMYEALMTILNTETAARIGSQSGALKGFDWKYHFDKVRKALLRAEGKEG